MPSGHTIEKRSLEGLALADKFSSPKMIYVSLPLTSHWLGLVTLPYPVTGSWEVQSYPVPMTLVLFPELLISLGGAAAVSPV